MSGRLPRTVRRSTIGCAPANDAEFAGLAQAIDDYLACHQERLRNEVAHYERTSGLRETIERAARAERPDGKRHDHQRRLPRTTLRDAERRLLAIEPELGRARTFHDLFLLVADALRPVDRAGELFVYDTSLRIGAKLGLRPDRGYLHCGTRKGVKRFHPAPGAFLDLSEVPSTLRRRLSPSEIEDFVCIYKDRVRSWT